MQKIESRAHRALRRLTRYQAIEAKELPEALRHGLILAPGESPIGIYRNNVDSLEEAILFTTAGTYLRQDENWVRMFPYSEFEQVISPRTKTEITGLDIVLYDGRQLWLPVRGSRDGRSFEAFEVWRFLNRVRDDLASAP